MAEEQRSAVSPQESGWNQSLAIVDWRPHLLALPSGTHFLLPMGARALILEGDIVTIEELEDKFPNGFHDAGLVGMTVDFPAGSVCIELDVDCDDPDPNVYTRIKFRLTGLSLFVVEPPDASISLSYGDTIETSGYETSDKILPSLEIYRRNVPAGSFFYSFFLNHWNCFLHVAATNAELESA